MKRFNDATGHQWELDVNLDSIERVQSICGIDLTKVFDDESKLLGRIFNEPRLLVSVLFCLCEDKITRDLGDESKFKAVMKGDALESGAKALVDDVIDFFPNPRRRKLLQEMVRKMWELTDVEVSLAEARLAAIDTTSLNSATSSVQSLASSPAGLHCES